MPKAWLYQIRTGSVRGSGSPRVRRLVVLDAGNRFGLGLAILTRAGVGVRKGLEEERLPAAVSGSIVERD
ncbi:MAG: hypothetical protein KJ749_11085 [Planctomycetes bacterium]|nr:hypothetical protein [Planctomycetota bacterium]